MKVVPPHVLSVAYFGATISPILFRPDPRLRDCTVEGGNLRALGIRLG
jgi:hypothetical protein